MIRVETQSYGVYCEMTGRRSNKCESMFEILHDNTIYL